MSDIGSFSLVRLFESDKSCIIYHLIGLSSDDKYLRFGYNPRDDGIVDYVSNSLSMVNTKESCDFWFGIETESGDLVATIHVSIRDNVAEFAFSTNADQRGKKLGQLLFARGYQLATEYKVSTIYMVFLSQNKTMRHIAKKFGMAVMTTGADGEASVNIQYPVPLNRVSEVKMSVIDKNLFVRL